jgi:PhnB protein
MQLIPYLMFNGNCEEALNFYTKALGGEIVHLSRYEGSPIESMASDKQKIMHATLIAKDIMIMGADDGHEEKENRGSGAIHLNINFNNPDEEEKIFNALVEGGRSTMPLQDTFWGSKFGMLTDKFGINWMLNCELKKK